MESAEGVDWIAGEFVYAFIGRRLHRQHCGYGEDAVVVAEFSGAGSAGATAAALAEAIVFRFWIHARYGRELSGIEAAGIAAVSQGVVAAADHLDGGELQWLRVHRDKYTLDFRGIAQRNQALNCARWILDKAGSHGA